MINFLDRHLIIKIEMQLKLKKYDLNHSGFFFFDKSIIDNDGKIIDKIKGNPYLRGGNDPIGWTQISGSTLMAISQRLKDNEFFVYKNLEGRNYKTRLKKDGLQYTKI